MCKKIFFVAGGALLVSTLVFGRDVFSYMSTAASNARAAIKDNVPVEFEIDRARRQITNLNPEIEKNRRLIAQEKVRVERLKTQIARLETKLQGDRRHIARLKSDLDSGTEHYVYAGQTFSADEVRSELKLLFEQYKTQESTLEKLEGILAARQKSVTAAERKLDSMLAVKRQLELDVANLEARLKMVEVAKTTSELQFDDSELSRTKKLIDDIRVRISVSEEMLDSEGQFGRRIPVTEEGDSDILKKIDEHFGTGSKIDAADDKELAVK